MIQMLFSIVKKLIRSIPEPKLCAATAALLNLETELIEAGITRLAEQERLVVDTVAGLQACYLPEFYEAERYVASRIADMARVRIEPPKRLPQLLRDVQERRQIDYAAQQRQAIADAAECRLLLVTGGPGTGKTTVMTGILDLFDAMGLKTQLAAPTGRAAKRLSEVTGREASTIHRLLEAQFDPDSGMMVFAHDETSPLKLDVLVVDECSMVDLQLMDNLLQALPPHARLILVGDPDQLPSVGAGNLLSDLIRSHAIPVVHLTEIFRQAQKSLIIMNAHAVIQGQMPELGAKDRDFFFLCRRGSQSVVETVCGLCATRLPQNMGIPAEEIQVLSPSRRYGVGTRALNQALQAVLNPPAPGKQEKSRGDFLLREGDRVMQIRNNYDILWKKTDTGAVGAGIYNGDIGVIQEIRPMEETLTVLFDEDRLAAYSFDLLPELELAYAMTVHKAQGSEYKAVVLVCAGGSPFLLTRSVLYTAITRARELLIVVGDEQTVAQMTDNDRRQRRYSGLRFRLAGGGEA